MTSSARINISNPMRSRNHDELSGLVTPCDRPSVGRFAARKLLTIVVRTVGVGFIVIWAGLFALVFLAVYGGLPLVVA